MRKTPRVNKKLEIEMRNDPNYDDLPLNVKMLWNDVQYIDTQIQALKSDLRYVMKLIEAFESELAFNKKEILCGQ